MAAEHRLLDIACGALRLGVRAIPYLNAGGYTGLDKEVGLIDAGLTKELEKGIEALKAPQFVITNTFDFPDQKFDYFIAQSLFTHLPANDVVDCLSKVKKCLHADSRGYATYFVTEQAIENPTEAHDHGYFAFTIEEIQAFGKAAGLKSNYIGDWGHPREQMMVEYRL